jgi:hypothetical protein
MTLILELPDSKQTVLQARARAQGLSAEQLAEQILNRELEEPSAPTPPRHISEKIREIMSDVPPEAFENLRRDGASEHDHYIYGTPKRNQ